MRAILRSNVSQRGGQAVQSLLRRDVRVPAPQQFNEIMTQDRIVHYSSRSSKNLDRFVCVYGRGRPACGAPAAPPNPNSGPHTQVCPYTDLQSAIRLKSVPRSIKLTRPDAFAAACLGNEGLNAAGHS